MRIDRANDRRLDGLAAAVRAELRAAGLEVAPDGGGAAGGVPAPAVITLKVDGRQALVVVTADGAAAPFSGAVALAEGRAPAAREVNSVALQVAEWLAAIWLPPPPPARVPAHSPIAGARAAAALPPEPAVVEPPPPVEPIVPPPLAPAPAPRTAPTEALRRALAAALAVSEGMSFDFGAGALVGPNFGTQLGFELGAVFHGAWLLRRLNQFARLGLEVFWVESGVGPSSRSTDGAHFNFASLTAASGVRLSLVEDVSVEASASCGVTLMWYVTGPAGADPSEWGRHRFVATPGGTVALVTRLSRQWAVAAQGRASWILPRPSLVGGTHGSDWPMIASTLALRLTL